ncbi:MAG: polysaccharide deacetylase family protein [Terracidiphilus sp.]|jgi:peptidoglycan/xylan/chitin deacetylase (PgdA/CDA1 family)/TolA-binding protein
MRTFCLLISAALTAMPLGGFTSEPRIPPAQQTAPTAGSPAAIAPAMDEIVAAYRKVIVLMDNAAALDEGNRERVRTAAWILFETNNERIAKLEEQLHADLGKPGSPLTAVFLTRLESEPSYRDADKLAFRDVVDGLANIPAGEASGDPLRKRIAGDAAALEKIQALYQGEISQIFSGLQARGMALHREAWEHYVAFLKTKYNRESILREFESKLPPAESRGGAAAKSKMEISGLEMPPKTVALTFDDGPHPRYTDQVLAILKKYGLHAVFFEIGRNVGTDNEKNEVTLGSGAAVSHRILESGSFLGNHTYTHPVLPKLDPADLSREIDWTSAILTQVLKAPPVLFRPPYGAANADILTEIQADKMKTVIWNVDSEDWADPVPNSVAQRVISEVEKQQRGILLFHDIHKVGLDALPIVIETLQADGYKFVTWNGAAFGPPETRGDQPEVASAPPPAQPYHDSWAAIIGIDDYLNWQKLQYAANDAAGVKDLLIQKYNFKPDHVFTLLNGQATRKNILSLLGDKLGDTTMVQREDRVLVFYAGHGATRKLASGRELGYIIPVDADLTDMEGTAISMTNFQDISEAIPAKHVLFVMDSCYSGLALTRGGSILSSQNYLNEISRREARQMFTAGGADQQVADNGPNGHSVFTWTLLQGLDGRADLNGDGVITATELAAYVAPAVSALSHQTPAFGNLPGTEGGDFIFNLKHETEFLNQDSAQLDDAGIKLNSELEKLRSQMREEELKNEELRKQLATAEAQLKQSAQPGGAVATPNPASGPASPTASAGATPAAPAKPPSDTAAVANDEGMRLYKEKQYADAAQKFVEAAKLQPASALYANNAGFAFFRMGQYDDAVKWYQQTIALDPKRAVAYLNLGDAYLNLQRKAEAKDAFEKFLALAPNSKSAPDVLEKMKTLP